MKPHCLTFAILAALLPAILTAQSPDTLSFQGRLTNPGGDPINTTTSMVFKLYKDGNEIWSETHPSVTVTDGVFNVELGGTTPLDTVAFNQPIELGIKVGTDAEMSPRTPLTSVAYALAIRGMHAFYRSSDEPGNPASYNVVGGHETNRVGPDVIGATISGGGGIQDGSFQENIVNDHWGTIAGGQDNEIVGWAGSIGGGSSNTLQAQIGTIAGGILNTVTASGGTIGGGAEHRAGNYATVPGGYFNWAEGAYSFAAGVLARANHSHSFVWNGSLSEVATTAQGQFLVEAPGGVGIGTDTPDAPFDIAGDNNWNLTTTDGDVKIGNDTYKLEIGVATGGGGAGISRVNAVGGVGALVLGGSETDVVWIDETDGLRPFSNDTYKLGTSSERWTEVFATNGTINSSDGRLKQDISGLSYGLSTVEALRPVSYRWRDRPESGERLGLIAQEVLEVVPEVVEVPDDPEGYLGLRYSELVPVLIKAIQEQQEQIRALHDLTERQQEEIGELRRAGYTVQRAIGANRISMNRN